MRSLMLPIAVGAALLAAGCGDEKRRVTAATNAAPAPATPAEGRTPLRTSDSGSSFPGRSLSNIRSILPRSAMVYREDFL